jgi:hypothetical protein
MSDVGWKVIGVTLLLRLDISGFTRNQQRIPILQTLAGHILGIESVYVLRVMKLVSCLVGTDI